MAAGHELYQRAVQVVGDVDEIENDFVNASAGLHCLQGYAQVLAALRDCPFAFSGSAEKPDPWRPVGVIAFQSRLGAAQAFVINIPVFLDHAFMRSVGHICITGSEQH